MNVLIHGDSSVNWIPWRRIAGSDVCMLKIFGRILSSKEVFNDLHFHQQTVLRKICVYCLKTIKTIASTPASLSVYYVSSTVLNTLHAFWNLILTNPMRFGGTIIFFMTLWLGSYWRAESRLESRLILLQWICVPCWMWIPGQWLTGNCVSLGSLRIKWDCTLGVAMLLLVPSATNFYRIGHGPVLPIIMVLLYCLSLQSPLSFFIFFIFLLCTHFKEIWLSSPFQVFFGNFNPVSGLTSHPWIHNS